MPAVTVPAFSFANPGFPPEGRRMERRGWRLDGLGAIGLVAAAGSSLGPDRRLAGVTCVAALGLPLFGVI
ncbi:MAG: hypothetical protein ABEJ55_03030 [Halanaeroarchaeum sp.]